MCGFALAGKDEQRAAQPMISLAPSNSTCTSVAAANKTTSIDLYHLLAPCRHGSTVPVTWVTAVSRTSDPNPFRWACVAVHRASIHTRVFAATEAAGNGQGSG